MSLEERTKYSINRSTSAHLVRTFRNAETLSGGDSKELNITDFNPPSAYGPNCGTLIWRRFRRTQHHRSCTSAYVPNAEPYLEEIRKNSTSQIHFFAGMGGRAKNGHRRPTGSSCDLSPSQQHRTFQETARRAVGRMGPPRPMVPISRIQHLHLVRAGPPRCKAQLANCKTTNTLGPLGLTHKGCHMDALCTALAGTW